MKKAIIIVVIILALLSGGFFITQGAKARQQASLFTDLETAAIERGQLNMTIGASGQVYTNQEADLLWKIPGQVAQVHVVPGQPVQAGDVLATMEQTSLPAFIILAQADLVTAQKARDDLLNSQAQQAMALKAVDEAEKTLEDAHNPELAQAQAQAAIAQAVQDQTKAQNHYQILMTPPSPAVLSQANNSILLAENKLAETLEQISDLEFRLTTAGAGLPPSFSHLKGDIKKALKNALEFMQIQRIQDQIALDNTRARFVNLQQPPDPTDILIAEAALFAAQAQLNEAHRQWDRIKDGFSPADIAVLEAKLGDTQREWERIKDGPNAADITIVETQIAAAEAALDQMQIVAPFDGVISTVHAAPGDQVATGVPAFRIDNFDRLLVNVAVSEIDIIPIEIGQQAILTLDAVLATEYHGRVIDIALVGTKLAGVVNFDVTIELTDADEKVRAGMNVDANIVISQIGDVLLVPNRAIRGLNETRVIYVYEELPLGPRGAGRFEGVSGPQGAPTPANIREVPITVGASAPVYSEVLSGDLIPGEVVIINPSEEIIGFAQEQSQP
jgi:HlyD family secretion protein